MSQFILANVTVGLIATVIATGLGFLWYGPVFGEKWGAIIGMKSAKSMTAEENKKFQASMGPAYALQMLVTFIQFGMASFFGVFLGRLNIWGALVFYALLWLGFIVPMKAGDSLWSGHTRKQAWQKFAIGAGYQLICFLVAAVIWTLVFPKFF